MAKYKGNFHRESTIAKSRPCSLHMGQLQVQWNMILYECSKGIAYDAKRMWGYTDDIRVKTDDIQMSVANGNLNVCIPTTVRSYKSCVIFHFLSHRTKPLSKARFTYFQLDHWNKFRHNFKKSNRLIQEICLKVYFLKWWQWCIFALTLWSVVNAEHAVTEMFI